MPRYDKTDRTTQATDRPAAGPGRQPRMRAAHDDRLEHPLRPRDFSGIALVSNGGAKWIQPYVPLIKTILVPACITLIRWSGIDRT